MSSPLKGLPIQLHKATLLPDILSTLFISFEAVVTIDDYFYLIFLVSTCPLLEFYILICLASLTNNRYSENIV